MGSRMTWVAITLALVGHAWCAGLRAISLGLDIGHIPVSNLYEVFVMFIWMTALFYLYYEDQYQTRALGGFVMLVVSAAVGFLLWYSIVREAHAIQPLVPALQSWWMKVHVPANFIGYGTFALAAMVAFAYLIKQQAQREPSGTSWRRCGCWAWRCALSRWLSARASETGSSYWIDVFRHLCADRRGHFGSAQTALPRVCPPMKSWTM